MAPLIKILLVEDEPAHTELILRSFAVKNQFVVETAADLKTAKLKIKRFLPDLVFTDWVLPDGDGIQLIQKDEQGNPLYPAIVMTSYGNEERAVEAMKAGSLDYIVKSSETFADMPHIAERALREWDHIVNRRKAEAEIRRAHLELTAAYETTLDGWSRALDLRDKETEGHTQRVVELTLQTARAVGLSQTELIHVRRGALLHDIGKMGIPDYILLKPGPLTAEEWQIMRLHPVYAYQLLYPITYLRPALDIPYCHHEKWDGTGYPQGLQGKNIPLAARIFAIIDVWDALRSNRPYRAAWPEEKARDYILEQAGLHFDPELVNLVNKRNLLWR